MPPAGEFETSKYGRKDQETSFGDSRIYGKERTRLAQSTAPGLPSCYCICPQGPHIFLRMQTIFLPLAYFPHPESLLPLNARDAFVSLSDDIAEVFRFVSSWH